jgi:hypothetical protein
VVGGARGHLGDDQVSGLVWSGMSGIGWMIAVSSQPDGLVQTPAPSFGCCEVAHQHTHAFPGEPHDAADTEVAESPGVAKVPMAAPTPLVPVQETDRRGSDPGREQLVG